MMSTPHTREDPIVVHSTPCADILADPNRFAPVSGPRCRDCGAHARRFRSEKWYVYGGVARCHVCARDYFGTQSIDLRNPDGSEAAS